MAKLRKSEENPMSNDQRAMRITAGKDHPFSSTGRTMTSRSFWTFWQA
jgi:hypothetical protein